MLHPQHRKFTFQVGELKVKVVTNELSFSDYLFWGRGRVRQTDLLAARKEALARISVEGFAP